MKISVMAASEVGAIRLSVRDFRNTAQVCHDPPDLREQRHVNTNASGILYLRHSAKFGTDDFRPMAKAVKIGLGAAGLTDSVALPVNSGRRALTGCSKNRCPLR
ncbi:MAG: hypothetical protein Q7T28_10730 [Cypionkella sp.]|uniref:hypothetical protein n=1 Tax=Cypionkella sp. TaxID=2811411 RepID=UPI0027274646|nr:hypothetical protein [Cypionkella sp.]MDO8327399.1 hypothetical protein [Cypionkella sp.]